MNYAIYSAAPGRILRTGHCSPDTIELQLRTGEAYIEVSNDINDATHYINSSGQPTTYPEKPSQFHAFDFAAGQYADQRTSQDFANATDRLARGSLAAIDTAAGNARLKYITSVPGQSETYQRKEEQARAWQAASFAGDAPSFIAAEATALAIDAQVLTLQIIALADYWGNVKGPQIEAARRKAKVAIESAGTDDSLIIAARDVGLAELALL